MDEETDLNQLSQRLASQLREDFTRYQGEDVRVDAGDPGMVYLAIRGARRQPEIGRALADDIAGVIEELIAEATIDVDFAVSLGTGNDDLLLQVELREV